jgi:hypothetical protein
VEGYTIDGCDDMRKCVWFITPGDVLLKDRPSHQPFWIFAQTVDKPKIHNSCTSKYLILVYVNFIKMRKLDFFFTVSL